MCAVRAVCRVRSGLLATRDLLRGASCEREEARREHEGGGSADILRR